jgi:signal transduction histidine kinase
VTVYGAPRPPRPHRPRFTLRLRLTLLSASLLLGAGLTLLLISWLAVRGVGAAERSLLLWELVALAVVSAAGIAAAHLIAGRALRPLHRVTAAARRLSGETLAERIHYDGADDEVAELAETFDAMLDRIAHAFDSQKRFVANASHELRTPLAVIRTEIDVTLADPDADATEYRRMATVVRDASIRANTLVESLLLLARTEAQSGRRLVRKQPADLSAGVSAALSTIEAEVKRLGLRVEVSLGDAPVVGDPSLLDRLAGNLIENAVRYNHYDGRLEVRTGSDDRHAWLVVANTGFEVDAADVPGLFEPFSRGGRERTGVRGSGLGLSIVRAVCDAHGGSATAVALAGGGLEVTVRLPAAATTPLLTASVPGPGR